MELKPIALAKGVATFIPGMEKVALRGTGGTNSARYCYAVWLCYLLKAAENELTVRYGTIAELGPGDSLGTGLAAMLTGVNRYLAFDAKPHANITANLATLEELIRLFTARTPIPGHDEFPNLKPLPETLAFPRDVLTDEILAAALHSDRLAAIRRAIAGDQSGPVTVSYTAPWYDVPIPEGATVDMAFSQAVLEHVEHLDTVYSALYRWLKPGAFMSHSIDFKIHGLTRDWFGHWTLSDAEWYVVKGRRAYVINRAHRRTLCSARPFSNMWTRRNSASTRYTGFSSQEEWLTSRRQTASGSPFAATTLNSMFRSTTGFHGW